MITAHKTENASAVLTGMHLFRNCIFGMVACVTLNFWSAAQAQDQARYYCPSANAYYPAVRTCPVPWQKVMGAAPAVPGITQYDPIAERKAQQAYARSVAAEHREYQKQLLADAARQKLHGPHVIEGNYVPRLNAALPGTLAPHSEFCTASGHCSFVNDLEIPVEIFDINDFALVRINGKFYAPISQDSVTVILKDATISLTNYRSCFPPAGSTTSFVGSNPCPPSAHVVPVQR